MQSPAYKKSEKISWHPNGNLNNSIEEGIIGLADRWGNSFHYLIEGRTPHCWVQEHWIVGWEDRRRLRDKIDNAPPLQIRKATITST